MNWREAFLKQARSDYSMFESLNEAKDPLCHKLHYLQMATEKMAKAYLCGGQSDPPKRTHLALVNFLKRTKSRPELRRKLGYDSRNYRAYVAYIDSLLDIAEKVEGLAPIGANMNRANPEYPWLDDNTGEVICPVEFGFPGIEKTDLVEFRKLVSNLFRVI